VSPAEACEMRLVRRTTAKDIDLPETLSNLTGKRIRRIKPDSVEFEDGTVIDLTKQDFEFFKLIKPMVWW
jgi:adenine-specific DNA-methyltransferase